MSMLRKQDRRGFTLTELAIVLGIMGAILGAIWTASSHVSASNKAQKAQGQVQMILSGYRSLFNQHKVDTGAGWVDITSMGINAGLFPSDMVSGSTVYNPWGTTVTVRGVQADNGIAISYYNLSKGACISLANSETNASGLIQSYIGNPAVNTFYPPYAGTGPLTPTQINAQCQATNTNEVTFEYIAQ